MPPVDGGAVVVDEVHQIEVHHMYDERGQHIYSQLIFWEATEHHGMRIVDWRLLKAGRSKPVFDPNSRKWITRFVERGTVREIRADKLSESASCDDPELVNREVWPKKNRRGLTPVRRP